MAPVSRSVTVAAVGAVVAVAAGIGANQAFASATPTPTTGTAATAPAAPRPDGDGDGRGPGGHHGRPGMGMDTAALAKALGVSEAKLSAALRSAREATRPSTPPAQGTRPSDADRAAREKAMAAALAKALGVSEAKVQAALGSVRAQREAEHRSELVTRLDAAVKAGTLSAADKASVLKAFDAGVLGGPRP
ncbi:hypothetical protein GCM10027517_33770 [Phycicoccus ginsengisoli]